MMCPEALVVSHPAAGVDDRRGDRRGGHAFTESGSHGGGGLVRCEPDGVDRRLAELGRVKLADLAKNAVALLHRRAAFIQAPTQFHRVDGQAAERHLRRGQLTTAPLDEPWVQDAGHYKELGARIGVVRHHGGERTDLQAVSVRILHLRGIAHAELVDVDVRGRHAIADQVAVQLPGGRRLPDARRPVHPCHLHLPILPCSQGPAIRAVAGPCYAANARLSGCAFPHANAVR